MLLKDALLRDPSRYDLVNNGQARIQNESADEKMLEQLRGELSSFVCEGQYADGMARILESFLRGRTQPSQQAAWVSGFFGGTTVLFLHITGSSNLSRYILSPSV